MLKVKALLVLVVGLLPASRRKNGLLNRIGYMVHPSARIAPIFLLRVRMLRVGARVRIGPFNLLRGLVLAEFGEDSIIGPRNRFWANPVYRRVAAKPELAGVLQIGNKVFLSKKHTLDCSGGFSMGDWSGIAGREVFVYSHSYDPRLNTMACAPTRVGRSSLVATKTTLAMGATLPDNCVLAMGGLLMPGATKTYAVYGGVPARPVVEDISGWEMFNRTEVLPGKRIRQELGNAAAPSLD